MSTIKKFIPGFRGTCLIVGFLNITFFLMMFSQGIMKSMAEFKVPETMLQSPYYADAMFWVFLHMSTIGILIILLGISVENHEKQLLVSRVLVVLFTMYLSLDLHTSDNSLGIALYKGPRSLFPVFIDVLYILLYIRLSFSKLKRVTFA